MKFYLFVLVIILFPFLASCQSSTTSSKNPEDLTELERTYKNYCLGCHNDKKSSFVNREWLWGNGREDVFKSIKDGKVAYGMPSFSHGLEDSTIYALTDYILNLQIMMPLIDEGEDKAFYGIEESEVQKFRVDTVVSGLDVLWGMAFLPNEDLLITERIGELYRFTKDKKLEKIAGLPPIKAGGQGGLLDIKLHPNYQENGWIYFAYSSPNEKNNQLANTAIMRARLKGNTLIDQQRIFKAKPETNKRHHYGCKMEFDKEGYLYFSVGDRGNRDQFPQSLDNHCGKIHRIYDDGRIPADNPFVNIKGAMPSIYSYGHRNPQGVCMHPETGRIWTDEHGPKGGDEINLIEPAKNYGWPVISFGINYNGTTFTNDTAKVGMEQPVLYWVPSIAPCGMTFVKGERYPGWKNNILTGSLRFEYLHRCVLENDKVIHQEKLLQGIGRVRNVEMSPDGYIYVAIENPGKILKIVPVE